MQTLPEDLKDLYPFQSNYLDLGDDLNLHYVDEGSGHPILFLHGNPTWSFFYRELIKTLSPQFRCIAPDHIGCGLSSKPQNYDYTLENHVNNIHKLINALDVEKFHLVVHDWGGAIGFGVAKAFPERVGRISILNTAAFLSKNIPLRIALCKTPILGELLIRGFNAFAGLATTMAVQKPLPEKVKRAYLFPYSNFQNRIATARFVRDIPLHRWHPSYSTLKSIDQSLQQFSNHKIQLHWAKKDFCFNLSFLKEWQKRFPNASTTLYAHAGHYILEDAPAAVSNNIRNFLCRA